MERINSVRGNARLLEALDREYGLGFRKVRLHRDMIGRVFFADTSTSKYVLKLYRPFHKSQALHGVDIMTYLSDQNYPVAPIVRTTKGETHFAFDSPQGDCVGVLFDYIDGVEPDVAADMFQIGKQVGVLHRIMREYPRLLTSRGKSFYIDRFIEILREIGYHAGRVEDLAQYGAYLWDRMGNISPGFCHGDLHSGNMFKTKAGRYVLFDFDVACKSYSLIDIATVCDGTNFNRLEPSGVEKTQENLERFLEGYTVEREVSDTEIGAVFSFVAIRHYELIATITECQGLSCLRKSFLDEQYEWLTAWNELCHQKRV